MRSLIIISLIQSVMITGCFSRQHTESSGDQIPVVYYNGETLKLNEVQIVNITDSIKTLYLNCDDFYELIVTNDLIDKIKEKEQYLEIVFPIELSWDAAKFGKQQIKRIFIPLSGKFASSNQVTFFYGISDYSNTPFSNSDGNNELSILLKELIE